MLNPPHAKEQIERAASIDLEILQRISSGYDDVPRRQMENVVEVRCQHLVHQLIINDRSLNKVQADSLEVRQTPRKKVIQDP